MNYLLLEKEKEGWSDAGGLYDTVDEAKEEIKAIIEVCPYHKESDFQIIPNDGKTLKNFRPLDMGDRIYR
jgi:hypothetical protein